MSLIYFGQAGDGGPIKIGFTAGDPLERIAGLQTGCPWPIKFICAVAGKPLNEVMLHNYFAAHQTYGEWFLPVPELLELIEQAKSPAFSWPMHFQLPAKKALAPETCPLRSAIRLVGSEAKLAVLIGFSQVAINKAKRKGWASAEMSAAIERALKGEVTRHQLRPDLFDAPPVAA